jgi:Tol biopolymer transport system component
MKNLAQKLILLVLTISSMNFCKEAGKIGYFGQIPPGLKPEKFAPGIISTDENEQNGIFSPDGKEFYFTKVTKKFEFIPFRIKITDNAYGEAEVCDIYDAYQGGEIFISPNGDKLFFTASIGRTPPNADIFCQIRTKEGWGKAFDIGIPVNTEGIEGYPCVSRDGTLYFYARREDSVGNFDLYSSKYKNGNYATPENLGSGINTQYNEFNPCISPDGSYLIFNSGDRPGNLGKGHDLYISFREENGSWSEAVNMGKDINSPESDYSAVVTADRKYIFFSSRRSPDKNADIYWFDADYVKELKKSIE